MPSSPSTPGAFGELLTSATFVNRKLILGQAVRGGVLVEDEPRRPWQVPATWYRYCAIFPLIPVHGIKRDMGSGL
jgi:hypothetical protein